MPGRVVSVDWLTICGLLDVLPLKSKQELYLSVAVNQSSCCVCFQTHIK